MKHMLLFSLLVVIVSVGFSSAHAIEITQIFVDPPGGITPGGNVQIFFDLTVPGPLDTRTYAAGSAGSFTIDIELLNLPQCPASVPSFSASCVHPNEFAIRATNLFGTRPPVNLPQDALIEFHCGPHDGDNRCPLVGVVVAGRSSTFGEPTIRLVRSSDGAGFVAWGLATVPEAGSTLSLLALSLTVAGLFAGTMRACRKE